MGNTYIFDLDGTLSLTEHRHHFLTDGQKPDWDAFFKAAKDDPPNPPVVTLFIKLVASGADVRIWTGRSKAVYQDMLHWLNTHHLFPSEIIMRKATDHRPDTIIKKEWLDEFLINNKKEDIVCAFDDRDSVVKMWRDEGIVCFQVAEGNF